MTTFQIKLLAAVLMVCDHIGAVIFPKILILRFLGRLSFPLFAWLIGQGEKNTNNFKLYLLRLVILGVISQPIYYLTFHSSALNILATLAFGLLAITGVLTKMQERQRESVPCCQWRDDDKTTFSQISQNELRST